MDSLKTAPKQIEVTKFEDPIVDEVVPEIKSAVQAAPDSINNDLNEIEDLDFDQEFPEKETA